MKMENKFIAIIFLLLSLTSCMSVATTGAQAVYDRHNIKRALNNQSIAMQSYRAIYTSTGRYKDANISVVAFNDAVLITGQIPSTQMKVEIGQIIKRIAESKQVYNLTSIGPRPSALTKLSDTWLTAKVKGRLIATDEIDPSQIKVITENGTVYLLGVIPHDQADIATNIARTTAGVQHVVKIFSYLQITKT